jgi:hypothetical protein
MAMAKYAIDLRLALWRANQDKAAMRAWVLGQVKPGLIPGKTDD